MEKQSTNPQIETARKLIETTSVHVFLTGRAGTGKTTFLRRLRKETSKRTVVLAPTGIAAINAEGQTIHSFFQLPFGPYIPGSKFPESQKVTKVKRKLIRSIDLLVIDEISMVRADLLDFVDCALRTMRRNSLPFGGVQLLMIGDLQQLSPVARPEEWNMLKTYYDSPYFFSSTALKQTDYVTIELQTIYRQTDTQFLALLNNIRSGRADKPTLDALNSRYIPNFKMPKGIDYIRLVTHNYQAQVINEKELERLEGKSVHYKAEIKGKFPDSSYPTEMELELKKGAHVMFLKNNRDKGYYNGMIGEVVEIDKYGFSVRPYNGSNALIEVEPEAWENISYSLDDENNIQESVDGVFTQFPVKTAWAITIHKSQGLTFDHVVINATEAFASGQTYVALSRCRTLEGIVLTAPLQPRSVIADKCVEDFNKGIQNNSLSPETIKALQQTFSLRMVDDLFSFSVLRSLLLRWVGVLQYDSVYNQYPQTVHSMENWVMRLDNEVLNVSKNFHNQYVRMLSENGQNLEDDALQERFRKGALYFLNIIAPLDDQVNNLSIDIDNKELKKRYAEAIENVMQELFLKYVLLEYVQLHGFHTDSLLKQRGKAQVDCSEASARKAWRKQHHKKQENPNAAQSVEDVQNKALYEALRQWRLAKQTELKVPAYVVMQNKVIIAICAMMPTTIKDLQKIPYITKKCSTEYANELLDIVDAHRDSESQ